MTDEEPQFDPKGMIWSAGTHHIYVNGEPAKVHVPESTIIPTYQRLLENTGDEGLPLGIDHLPDEVLEQNSILQKMNLHDVGRGYRFGTDGKAIYMLDGDITNPTINELGLQEELTSYSSVGKFRAGECERNDIDYVFQDMTIDRADYVGSGGCQACKVGAEPTELILTAKLSLEVDEMATEQLDEVIETTESVEQTEEVVESTGAEEVTEIVEASEPEVDKDEFEALKAQVKDLKFEAAIAKAEPIIEGHIQAGHAVPAQKDALIKLAVKDRELFNEFMAASPKIIDYEQKSRKVEAQKAEEHEAEASEPEVDEFTGRPILNDEQVKEGIEILEKR